ncbi:MAG: PAS domain S-box protein [Oscillochloris sp.]|nr:PAS domain S-box protein [Oscillochloris sp.]
MLGLLLATRYCGTTGEHGSKQHGFWRRLRQWFRKSAPNDLYAPLVAQHTSDLIALLNTDGRYCYVSPSHERRLGYTSGMLIGRTCREIIHPDDLKHTLASWAEALNQRPAQTICRVATADGDWCWVQVQIRALNWRGEYMIMLVARDMSVEREQVNEMMQMQRTLLMGSLASAVIHDLNNMLTIVESTAGMAEEDLPDQSQLSEDLAAIRYASRHAGDLTRSLLTFARGRGSIHQPLNLSRVMYDMQPLLSRITGKQITLKVDLEEQVWLVLVDQIQIEQVIVNLVMNARDAMPEGGYLCIRTRNVLSPDHRGMVRIEVSDTGKGIPHEMREHIFKPFVSTKNSRSATGLGLASCRWIVEQLGGTIEVASIVGHGSTFAVVLPRVP